ncbi:helix-turn-helix transcriptional regulator [Planotetraspora mira]|uniref:helix-turn-helix transcriptional regulator n=1 Tax=Planotetraspora mira TaxID=58121 RepID=UPI001EF2AA5F|nr:LuxR C-terminal-related transcriptional regulator [Planotetraspora mira]
MEYAGFAQPSSALVTAAHIMHAPASEMATRLSAALADDVPHRAVALLATQCASSPVAAVGDQEITDTLTGAVLGALVAQVTPGHPWQGTAHLAGGPWPVLAVASDLTPRGAGLVMVLDEDTPVTANVLLIVQALVDLLTSHVERLVTDATPNTLAQSRAVAQARTHAVAELGEAHAAALSGILGVLRSHRLDDTVARSTAVDLAVNALLELRNESPRGTSPVWEESARQAFGHLSDSLKMLLSHSAVQLELDPPANDRSLTSVTAHAAKVSVRAAVLAALQQSEVRRIRVGWQLGLTELVATVRDDGPGLLNDDLRACQIAQRVEAQGGSFELDAVPGWGMTTKLTFPLALSEAAATRISRPVFASFPDEAPGADPLAGLGARELEVLEHLALGHRNRTIAQELHISESTVKFHVANILSKLSVGSRGEAAAFFHSAAV